MVLSPRDPYPVIGGDRVRIHSVAHELAKHYDLTLLTLCRSRRERDAPPPQDRVFKRVHRVVMPAWRSWVNVLTALPTQEPLQVAYYRNAEFRSAVESLAPEHDAVLAHLVRTADYARNTSALRVLEMTDAISMNMQRVARAKLEHFDFRRLLYAIDARRLRAYEHGAMADFDLVSLTSKVDRAFLFGRSGEQAPNVMVVPNGVNAPQLLPPPQTQRVPGEVAFVANLTTLQNFDAACIFARRIWPLIRARRPDAIFRIIGPIRKLGARKLSVVAGVRVEGVVKDLESALATARVGVCPMRLGAGIQNKVLDYFANRLAVVCSPMGMEGIQAQPDVHLLVARHPEEWAAQVLRLLEDTSLAQRVADAGRELSCRHYRWSERAKPLLNRLHHLFEQPQRAEVRAQAEASLNIVPALVETGL